jgi:hypothetical protein
VKTAAFPSIIFQERRYCSRSSLVGRDCSGRFLLPRFTGTPLHQEIEIKVDKALPPSDEKLKQCRETDNRLRCLTIFILEPGQSQN